MSSSRVHVVGSLNEDLVLAVDEIPVRGETRAGSYLGRGCGGKGANQAVAAARAGASVHMVGCVGSDEAADRLVGALLDEGIDVSGVTRVDGPSGLAVVSVAADGENAIIVAAGANGRCTPQIVHSALAGLEAGDVVVAQGELPVSTVDAASQGARAASARFVLNLAPPLDVDPADVRLDLLVVNEHEAATLAGTSGFTNDASSDIAVRLARTWQSPVVVTLGKAGALWAEQDEVERIAPFRAQQVLDTTGAGDAFVGALAAALALGTPPRDAVRWGLAAGAIAVAAPGAQGGRATPERIADLLAGAPSLDP